MTSAFQRERLDFLLDRLANDEPLQLGLDQKNDKPLPDEPLPLDLDQKNDWLHKISALPPPSPRQPRNK